jgi:hypothetical protein
MALRNSGAIVRRNRILDSSGVVVALVDAAVVEDNVIDGVVADGSYGAAMRLFESNGTLVRGNTIRDLRLDPAYPGGTMIAIDSVYQGVGLPGSSVRIEDNVLVNEGQAGVSALTCTLASTRYADNVVAGFATLGVGCTDAGNNDMTP